MLQVNPAGQVVLLSAGPGDLELLTLKAIRHLARADVLLLDDLVNPDIVTLAPHARVLHVGKRGGCRSTPQTFILRLMKRYAQRGARVVRVKGGEVLLFGRAGEEIQYLRQHGIAVEIVNGVSAALAAAASLQVSLTHRAWAAGVTLVTAHLQDGSEPDWATLARGGTTLAIYMGISRLTNIVSALIAHLPSDTPIAVVEAASTHAERRLLTTLDQVLDEASRFQPRSPAMVLVGAALHEAILTPVQQATHVA